MVSLDIERQSLSFTLVDSILKRNEHREARASRLHAPPPLYTSTVRVTRGAGRLIELERRPARARAQVG